MITNGADKLVALETRIRHFYESMNRHDFTKCYAMIDPRVVSKSEALTISQYTHSLERYLDRFASINLVEIGITGLHLNEPNKLYEGRDFALGKTVWEDDDGNRHEFSERWVFQDGAWYTRSTGFVPIHSSGHTAEKTDNSDLRTQ